MTVLLLENYPHDGHESMQRYAGMVRRFLTRKGIRVETIRPEPCLGRMKPSGAGLGKWLGYFDKFVLFPFVLRWRIRRMKREGEARRDSFLVHVCDHSNAMYTRWLRDVPHLVSCHDVLAIQSARGLISGQTTGWTGRLLQRWILSGLRQAQRVLCVSAETQKDLLALAPELQERVQTIENALNYDYAPMSPDSARKLLAGCKFSGAFSPGTDRFLFHVGGNQWYKNRETVLHILSRLRTLQPKLAWIKLVMAGKPPTDAMLKIVEHEKLDAHVIFASDVSDEQLGALYSLAEALVFPSLKEGFGWPLIEAQACGCPVVTSDRPPMNRLAGPAALVANPEDPTDFADKICLLLSEDTTLRQGRKEKACAYAALFSSETFTEQLLGVYQSIL